MGMALFQAVALALLIGGADGSSPLGRSHMQEQAIPGALKEQGYAARAAKAPLMRNAKRDRAALSVDGDGRVERIEKVAPGALQEQGDSDAPAEEPHPARSEKQRPGRVALVVGSGGHVEHVARGGQAASVPLQEQSDVADPEKEPLGSEPMLSGAAAHIPQDHIFEALDSDHVGGLVEHGLEESAGDAELQDDLTDKELDDAGLDDQGNGTAANDTNGSAPNNSTDIMFSGLDAAHAKKLEQERVNMKVIQLVSVERMDKRGNATKELELENAVLDMMSPGETNRSSSTNGTAVIDDLKEALDNVPEPVDAYNKLDVIPTEKEFVTFEKEVLGDQVQDLMERGAKQEAEVNSTNGTNGTAPAMLAQHQELGASRETEGRGTAPASLMRRSDEASQGSLVSSRWFFGGSPSPPRPVPVPIPPISIPVPIPSPVPIPPVQIPVPVPPIPVPVPPIPIPSPSPPATGGNGAPIWPKSGSQHTIKFCRGSGLSNKAWDEFKKAYQSLHEHCETLNFVEDSGSGCQLSVKGNGDGCWAHVGYSTGTREVNLEDPGSGGTCATKGIAEHELCHTLGMYHEQARVDRDSHVTYYSQNTQSDKRDQFDKNSAGSTSESYDLGSIMHYGCKAFGTDDWAGVTQDTIRAHRRRSFWDGHAGRKDCEEMGQRSGLSGEDIEQLQRMYSCTNRRRRAASPSPPTHYINPYNFNLDFGGLGGFNFGWR